jgi:hypothetical protein
MYFTDNDIKQTAGEIWRERKARNDPDADNADENWRRAEERLCLMEFWQSM